LNASDPSRLDVEVRNNRVLSIASAISGRSSLQLNDLAGKLPVEIIILA
jgi:hypothetical protein